MARPITDKKDVTVVASAARTASGEQVFSLPASAKRASLTLDASAAGGTNPTLDVKVQVKDAASGAFTDLVTFLQKTAAGRERKVQDPLLALDFKLVWTIGGTAPTFTFSVGCLYEVE